MSLPALSNIVRLGLAAGLLARFVAGLACSSPDGSVNVDVFKPGGFTGSDASSGGTSGTGGFDGSGADAPDDTADDIGAPGEVNGRGDITNVLPTAGCGKSPGQTEGVAVRGTIATMGTKPDNALDSKKGPWSYEREYFVTLPRIYNSRTAYPLVLQAPGCGAIGTSVYSLNNSADDTVIRVGLTPPPHDIGHASNPGQGCFDDHEGDASVDFVFYEALYDKLAEQFCFDRNRVFVSGYSSGGAFANELGCRYAGDAARPIRGVLSVRGHLPAASTPRAGAATAPFIVTCVDKPLAGMWIYDLIDEGVDFRGDPGPVNRAMQVSGCAPGTTSDNAPFEFFPVGGGNPESLCKKIRGCHPLYPLVVCALPGFARGSHDSIVNPGFATYLKLFSKAPLLTPP